MTTIGIPPVPSEHPLGPRRVPWLRFFLWMSAVGWATALGAKLFDLVVLASAWGAAPPASLALMPYGRLYPINPGDFFQPLSALLLFGSVGALAVGWRVPRAYRLWLLLPVLMLAVIWVLTPTVFWPMINDLWAVSKGRLSLSSDQINSITHQWFVWDWLRIALIATGFVANVQAMSTGYRHGL